MPIEKDPFENCQIHLVSLGCPKNLVDSEHLLGLLSDHGARVTEDPDQARVIIINTCAFIESAVSEAIETILEMAANKPKATRLVVIGCLPQRYREDLVAIMPEVDLFWGAGRFEMLPERISRLLADEPPGPCDWTEPGFVVSSPGPRLRAAPFYRAYLKIAEGCSNACTYCLIPSLRGPYRSRPLDVLVEEASLLVESGVRELILVAQDTTVYGGDLPDPTSLAALLKGLDRIPGLDWIKVMYAYPSGMTDELIDTMAEAEKVCAYLDLPLQHVSPRILKRMGRKKDGDLPALVRKLRARIKGLSLRTTLMVGFPGETDEDFEMLLDFVAESRFEHLGVFKFCPEEGAPASGFPDQVPQRIKENRRRKIMALQRRISREINRSLVGRTLPVLVEGLSPETDLLLVGRTSGQAPEIDGQVLINKGIAGAGEMKSVLFTESHDYDLVGEIVED